MNLIVNKKNNILFVLTLVMLFLVSSTGAYIINTNRINRNKVEEFKNYMNSNNFESAKLIYNELLDTGREHVVSEINDFLSYRLSEEISNLTLNVIPEDKIKVLKDLYTFKENTDKIVQKKCTNILNDYSKGAVNIESPLRFYKNVKVIGYHVDNETGADFEKLLNEYYKSEFSNAEVLFNQSKYQEAIKILDKLNEYFPNDLKLLDKLHSYMNVESQEKNLVSYNGTVEHIFFHPLIAYPELSFTCSQAQGYRDYFVTVSEFKKIIQSLYDKNFILIDINMLYNERTDNGNVIVEKPPLSIPKGKKPLIISVDDLNYYKYMIQDGNVYKLILGSDGDIATYSRTPSGQESISYDNEIIPILNKFVDEHPDFSFKGAKGCIALTGYEGILGYRTQSGSSNRDSEISAVEPIVQKLKNTGWVFASHSFGHPNAASISFEQFARDTDKWESEVEPLIGSTKIYVYPFGSRLTSSDSKLKYLLDSGFKLICAVGPTSYIEYTGKYVAQDRRHIDGTAFESKNNPLKDLCDVSSIIDSARYSYK